MANKTIKYAGIKLSVDGAAEFQKNLNDINLALKTSKAEMQLVTAEFGKNSNSIEVLTAKQTNLKTKLNLNKQEQQALNEMLTRSIERYGANSEEVERLKIKLLENESAQIRIKKALDETTKSIDGQPWTKLGQDMESVGKKMKDIGDSITDVGKKLTLGITTPIVGLGTASAKLAIDFESAFTGVRKTVDATETEFKALETGIRDMAKQLPTSATEIAQVAESAGQLGIETPNILEFTRTMVDLGEATSLTASQAATSFARFANIVDMPHTEFDRLGSTVVALGNNFATTEAEIVEMAMRLAGAGTQVGLNEAQIMAFSTALSSVGIQSELGGSAFSRLMVAMSLAVETGSSDLESFANAAGMTAEQFQESFKEDAGEAIVAFISGLKQMGLDGESVIKILDDMGIKEVGLRDTILRAAGAADVLNEAIEIGNNAWEENTALANEAEQRYATMESRMSMLKNQFIDIGIQIGEILMPYIEESMKFIGGLVEKFSNLDDSVKKNILTFAGITATVGPILTVLGKMISIVGSVTTKFGVMASAIGKAGGLSASFAKALALVSNPIGAIVAVMATLTIAGIELYNHFSKELIPEIEHFGKGVSEATQEATKGFLDMNEQMTRDLTTLSVIGGEITSELKESMVSNITAMASETKTALESAKEDSLATLNSLFENTVDISDKEKHAIIEDATNAYNQKLEKIESAEAEIKEIMQLASNEKRTLSQEEMEIITRNQELIATEGIKYMTDSEREQKIILEKMKDNSSLISAQQAAEVVRNSVEQKESVVKEAEEQYNKTLAEIIKQRDEIGSISNEQADILIKEAKRQREETIINAEEMHSRIVEEAQNQAKEHVDKVNWETGEILTKWHEFYKNISKKWNEIKINASETWNNIKTNASETWNNIKDSISNKVDEMKTAVSNKANEIKTTITDKWNEITIFLNNINLFEVGENIIKGLANGIKSSLGNAVSAARETSKAIADTIKGFFNINSPSKLMMEYGGFIGGGLGVGIESTENDLIKTAREVSKSISDNINIDTTGFTANIKDIVDNTKIALPELERKINQTEATRQEINSQQNNTFNFEGFFKDANFIVQNESDIDKIANTIIKDALPELRNYITASINSLEKRIPEIASNGQMAQLRQMGFSR